MIIDEIDVHKARKTLIINAHIVLLSLSLFTYHADFKFFRGVLLSSLQTNQ